MSNKRQKTAHFLEETKSNETDHLFELISLGCSNIDEAINFLREKHEKHEINFHQVEEDLGNSLLLHAISNYSICENTTDNIFEKVFNMLNLLIDLDTQHIMTGKMNDTDDTPLIYTSFFIANPGFMNIAKKLLDTGHSKPSVQEIESENTALMLLCNTLTSLSDHPTVFQPLAYLISHLIGILKQNEDGSESFSFENAEQDTVLTILCKKYIRDPQLKHYITDISISIIDSRHSNPGNVNNSGKTALIYAIENRFTDISSVLINKLEANIEFVSSGGVSALAFLTSDLYSLNESEVDLLARILKHYIANDQTDPVFVKSANIICHNIDFLRSRLQPRFPHVDLFQYCREPIEVSAIFTGTRRPPTRHSGYFLDSHRNPRIFQSVRQDSQSRPPIAEAEPVHVTQQILEEGEHSDRIFDPRSNQWYRVNENNVFSFPYTGETYNLGENPGNLGRLNRVIFDDAGNMYNPDQFIDPDQEGSRLPTRKGLGGGKKRKKTIKKRHLKKKTCKTRCKK